jgi:hypothetical protein
MEPIHINVNVTVSPSTNFLSLLKKAMGIDETETSKPAEIEEPKRGRKPKPELSETTSDDFLADDPKDDDADSETEEITLDALKRLGTEKASKSAAVREKIKKTIESFGSPNLKGIKKSDYAALYLKLQKL